jgi:hypothetical protein
MPRLNGNCGTGQTIMVERRIEYDSNVGRQICGMIMGRNFARLSRLARASI